MNLVKIVSNNTKVPMGLVLLLITIVLYFSTNVLYLGQPTHVPLTFVDIWALHSPVWIWVYVTYYFYLIGIYLSVRNEELLNQIYYCYLAAGLSGAMIFFSFPSTVPRELYPLSADPGLSEMLLGFIRRIDQSLNCAPSMHVAFSTIAALTFWHDRHDSHKTRVGVASWGLLIFYSTMATKQHYFLDVISGFALGAVLFFIFSKVRFR
jgi:membrane-associated phospholipid phosphatase